MLSGNEIRERFLAYFESKGHTRVASSSLVPYKDPTLLFTNAGMNQFKDVFLGLEKRQYTRATSSQKCVRAGGKHNDLETVGKTARHHTFFEMLGNFSFGDYFKREAITYAWDFLTKEMSLPEDKLYATIYQDDDEAYDLWRKLTSIPPERIIRLGEKDNFWSMGDTGPCGPCSEVLIDRGEKYSCGSNCGIGKCDCDRFLEIWNLVFMQYNRDADGKMTSLPRPSIDTGMGLERITSVVQNVESNYDTDLIKPLLQAIESLCGKIYYQDQRGFAFRVVADHIRSCTFLISDGVLPSNEGRGYVLRRILRRAIRFGKVLGIEDPFMYKLVPVVINLMEGAYPEIKEKADYLAQVILREEERFHVTLNEGIHLAQEIVHNLQEKRLTVIPGEEAFRLYDTFGFPLDLTEDIAEEAGLEVDVEGFNRAMEEQRAKARSARQEVKAWDLALTVQNLAGNLPASKFTGYDLLEDEAEIWAILKDGELVNKAKEEDEVYLIISQTPFYAEGGGQASDTGAIIATSGRGKVCVENTKKMPDGKIVHQGVVSGEISTGEKVKLLVDISVRRSTAKNHTATHLLQKSLQIVLGDHVQQAGSFVEGNRLRFDFTHFTALTREEVQKVEDLVNDKIAESLEVTASEMSLEEAKKLGAMALFGEKYGDVVRVVQIGDFSKELCGGTHVGNTSQLGLFKIVSESAVGSGLRRIEAVTGQGVRRYLADKETSLEELAVLLKTPEQELFHRVQGLLEELKQKEKALEQLESTFAKMQVQETLAKVIKVRDVSLLVSRVEARDMETLRNMADMFRDKLSSGVVVLGTAVEGKVNFVVAATKDVTLKGVHAGKLIKEIAKITGGGGGGKPEMAQAGGKDVAKLEEALAKASEFVENQLKK
ncbi:MAG: alanine--tRNA ligase [Peptococcia bacterium]|jgi:alanyl-tRNA synthetase